jgi:class 3 adenylate cyclase
MTQAFVLSVRQPSRQTIQVLVTSRLAFGRDCDGILLADTQVSRSHAEFRIDDGQLVISDLGSANGTKLNGQLISASTVVVPGDVIALGSSEIEVGSMQARIATDRRQSAQVDRPKSKIIQISDVMAADPGLLDAVVAGRDVGTFTIVFSDIEGSTTMASSLGDDAWMSVLDRHNRVFRNQLARHSGREVKSQGDGFMLSFDSARRAVDFAVDVQRELAVIREADPTWAVRIRIGVHSGEAITTPDGDLFGRHVIIASRIADQADGDEILVSSLVRELVAGRSDLLYGESRLVHLKGLGEQTVHAVAWRTN